MARRAGTSGGRRVKLMLAAPFVLILTLLASTGSPEGAGEDVGVDRARARWESAHIAAYDLSYSYRGRGPAEVHFADGVVTGYSTADPRLEDATIYWVDTLFDEIEAVQDDLAGDVVSVEFDPELGYPLRATLDPDRLVAGDEWSFVVHALVVS